MFLATETSLQLRDKPPVAKQDGIVQLFLVCFIVLFYELTDELKKDQKRTHKQVTK